MAPLKASTHARADVIPFTPSPLRPVNNSHTQPNRYKNAPAGELSAAVVTPTCSDSLTTSNPFVVAVVDDERDVLEVLEDYLDAMECTVVAFQDSREAADYLQNFGVDAVLLDRRMPEIDGFTLAELVRASQLNQAVPIGMLSGLDDVESMQESFNCGITVFLGKPLCWDRLARMVNVLRITAQGRRRNAADFSAHAPIPVLRDIQPDHRLPAS